MVVATAVAVEEGREESGFYPPSVYEHVIMNCISGGGPRVLFSVADLGGI